MNRATSGGVRPPSTMPAPGSRASRRDQRALAAHLGIDIMTMTRVA
jgi:hypothetical protein